MPVAIVTAIVLTTLGVFLYAPIAGQADLQTTHVRERQAQLLAESALDVAFAHLREGGEAKTLELEAPEGSALARITAVEGREQTFLVYCFAQVDRGRRNTTHEIHAAVRLGAPESEGSPRPVIAHALGETEAVLDSLAE